MLKVRQHTAHYKRVKPVPSAADKERGQKGRCISRFTYTNKRGGAADRTLKCVAVRLNGVEGQKQCGSMCCCYDDLK